MRRFLFHIALLTLLAACGESSPDHPARPMPAGLEQDRAGQEWAAQTFLAKCAYCHGHVGEGRGERADFFDPPAPDFYQRKYRSLDPAYLYWRIAEGKMVEPFLSRGSVMPAWGMHFSERQIWQLVLYLQRRAGAD